eukprot:maker-scaffold716_size107355-snap-gene-0.27 protein:Tk05813 transcript:maker-scaffold716_size107355-snap-gene-0.27-mRNA-1 annotation:"atp-dependent rna helicase ddx1"
MAAFEEFGVLPELAVALDEMGWSLPTDVQAEAIPLILGGGDVLMAAETGSGKTGAFCLPVLQITWESRKSLAGLAAGDRPTSQTIDAGPESLRMSVQDRSPLMAISPDGCQCQVRHPKVWHGSRATRGVLAHGQWYYEAWVEDEGLCRFGFATAQASLDLGTCPKGFGFGSTGRKSHANQFDAYGEAFGRGDVIGCFLDLDQGQIAFAKNGQDLGVAFALTPKLGSAAFFPAIVLK